MPEAVRWGKRKGNEMSIKEYKLSVIKRVSSGDLMW
jgi:hypothetical protein